MNFHLLHPGRRSRKDFSGHLPRHKGNVTHPWHPLFSKAEMARGNVVRPLIQSRFGAEKFGTTLGKLLIGEAVKTWTGRHGFAGPTDADQITGRLSPH